MKSFSANRSKPFIFPLNFVKANNRYEGKERVKDEAMLEADQTTPTPPTQEGKYYYILSLKEFSMLEISAWNARSTFKRCSMALQLWMTVE